MSFAPNIILLGFMGSGKTVTGVAVSKALGLHFWDMDQWIEKTNKQKIPDIFEKKGEGFFRQQESKAISWLSLKKSYVVATGGGAWLKEENRKKLLHTGWCVWLKVSAEDVWERVGSHLEQRPILHGSKNPKQLIKSMLDQRNPYYELAHAHFDTAGKDPGQVAAEIVRNFKKTKPFSLTP